MKKKIDIGCGDKKREGYDGLDIVDFGQKYVADVRDGLDFEDESFDEVRTSHFIEHLLHDEAIEFLNECWRILKSDGIILLVTPSIRKSKKGYLFGHRSFYTKEKFMDLDRENIYDVSGIRRWETENIVVNGRGDIHWRGRPVK